MCLCTFCTHGSGAFNKYVAKFTHFVWKIFARQSLPSKNFGLFGSLEHTQTNLRLRILYFGERTSDNHPSYLDYHVSSRLRQSVSIYVIFHMKIPLPFLDQHFPHFLVLKKNKYCRCLCILGDFLSILPIYVEVFSLPPCLFSCI